ncbi:hypothetical protein HK104_003828 [Borealophlyctis nickersoniae]|nr:hypothetical protein HK104_003828 [Borealophlyctis nickersoniae]
MYVKVIHRNHTYGPIRAPTTLRTLCLALHISARSSPCLVDSLNPEAFSTGELDVDVPAGLYELVCRDSIEYDSAIDDVVLGRTAGGGNGNSKVVGTASQTQINVDTAKHGKSQTEGCGDTDVNVRGEDGRWVQGDGMLNRLETPLPASDLEIGIEALIYLVSSIPGRYIKYNAVLGKKVDRAMAEVERLHEMMREMQGADQKEESPLTQNDPEKCSNRKSKSPQHAGSRNNLTHIPAATRITFIQYRLSSILYATWAAVWARYAPASRLYHVSDVATISALDAAEHCINRLHVWRRTLDAHTWQSLKQSSTASHLVDVTKIARRHKYFPRIVNIQSDHDLDGDIESYSQGWDYLARPPSAPIDVNPHPPKTVVHVHAGEALKEVRRLLVDALIRTKIHRDQEMDVVLDELIEMDRVAKTGERMDKGRDPPIIVYPSDAVRRALRKEFNIRSQVPLAGGK